MASATQKPATIEDLYGIEGKAELIAGRIVRWMIGCDHSLISGEIYVGLRAYVKALGRGKAFPDGMGFALVIPLRNGRQSFSPDASYYLGPYPADRRRFIEGTPTLAVEVRSLNDYGKAGESAMKAKRADYFEAGTEVVWDVDPEAKTVASYRGDPSVPVAIFRSGDIADAEPAVPGWRMAVDEMFLID